MKEYGRFAIAGAILIAGVLFFVKEDTSRYEVLEDTGIGATRMIDTKTGDMYMSVKGSGYKYVYGIVD